MQEFLYDTSGEMEEVNYLTMLLTYLLENLDESFEKKFVGLLAGFDSAEVSCVAVGKQVYSIIFCWIFTIQDYHRNKV